MGYRNQPQTGGGTQSGPSYPNLSKDGNPLQRVRDTYRQTQEDAYKMQPGPFMPEIANVQNTTTSDNRAITGQGLHYAAEPLRDKNASGLDDNLGQQWVRDSFEVTEGRK